MIAPYAKVFLHRDWYLSRAGHVKPGLNLGGPPSKAKNLSMTDSEPVPRGKGEKNPSEGSEKNLKPAAYKRSEAYASL